MVVEAETVPKGKHKPPSKIKYDLENPPCTIRLTKDTRAVLIDLLGGRKYSEAIRDILTEKLKPALEIKKKMEAEQAEKCAKCGWCPTCRKEKIVYPNAKRVCPTCNA